MTFCSEGESKANKHPAVELEIHAKCERMFPVKETYLY